MDGRARRGHRPHALRGRRREAPVGGHGRHGELVRLHQPRRLGRRRPDEHGRAGLPARQRRRQRPQPRLRHRRLDGARRARCRRLRARDPRLDGARAQLPRPDDVDRRPRRARHAEPGVRRPHHPGRSVGPEAPAAGQAARRPHDPHHRAQVRRGGRRPRRRLRAAARRRRVDPAPPGERRRQLRHRRLRRLGLHGRLVQPDPGQRPHGRRELPVQPRPEQRLQRPGRAGPRGRRPRDPGEHRGGGAGHPRRRPGAQGAALRLRAGRAPSPRATTAAAPATRSSTARRRSSTASTGCATSRRSSGPPAAPPTP